jgi:hypothetical protein
MVAEYQIYVAAAEEVGGKLKVMKNGLIAN